MGQHRLASRARRHGLRSPGRRAVRDKGRVFWPSILKDEKGREHHRMYVMNPLKYIWDRWPGSSTDEHAEMRQRLIMRMVDEHQKMREKGYLDG